MDFEGLGRDVEARTPEIERLGDRRALVFLRRLELAIALTRLTGLEAAAERLLAAAQDTGDRPNALEALFFLCASGVLGPVPVDEALSESKRRLRGLAQGPVEEATVEHMEGLLRGMRGEFDEGLRTVRKSRATFAEFGLKLTAVSTARDEALIARYAGDPAAAERALRSGCDELRAFGETGYLSTEVGELAAALYELERYDEADEACRECARLAQDADVFPQVVWRRVRAKLLARAGERDEALRLAHEAIELAGTRPEEVGDAYRDLAEVEQLVGGTRGAEEALERALAAYEQKGLVPMAERTRGQLAELRATR